MKYQKELDKAISNKDEIGAFFKNLKNDKSLDEKFNSAHNKAFEETDCLSCANCCKKHSPIILQSDMDRIAKHLQISTGEFIQQYLEMDEEGDFVYQQTPCPFLASDNTCNVYEVRPEACAEYPHTNQSNIHQILDLTQRNYEVCPAVFKMVEAMRKG